MSAIEPVLEFLKVGRTLKMGVSPPSPNRCTPSHLASVGQVQIHSPALRKLMVRTWAEQNAEHAPASTRLPNTWCLHGSWNALVWQWRNAPASNANDPQSGGAAPGPHQTGGGCDDDSAGQRVCLRPCCNATVALPDSLNKWRRWASSDRWAKVGSQLGHTPTNP